MFALKFSVWLKILLPFVFCSDLVVSKFCKKSHMVELVHTGDEVKLIQL